MSLPPEVQASYVVIIDSILTASDLNTITSRRIREGLQSAVEYDITPQKDAIKNLIMTRFNKFVAERNAVPRTNGHANPVKSEPFEPSKSSPLQKIKEERKRASDDDDRSDVPDSPPPKKKRKAETAPDDDAAFAAKLQAEENSRARPTRGGVVRKSAIVKKKKKKSPKKKTANKIKAEDDSDMERSGSEVEQKKVNRSGGFHKPLTLSAPLSALLDNEVQLSRPQIMKKIWAYIHAQGLQDQADKRQIICDEPMRAVFKQDKVHMFTMVKILNQNLYNPEE